MPRKPRKKQQNFSEKDLTKGQLRKLNALRRSLGDEQIANEAFAKWLRKYGSAGARQGEVEDRTATIILETLEPLVLKQRLKFPRGGYLLRRGRGRVIVEQAQSS